MPSRPWSVFLTWLFLGWLLIEPLAWGEGVPLNLTPSPVSTETVISTQETSLPDLGIGAENTLPLADEMSLGERIYLSLMQRPNYLDDPMVTDALNQMGHGLLKYSPIQLPFRFEFFALNNPAINAFALPGGFIGINTGLILLAQNESELASVLAHEISHVLQRHIIRMLENQKRDGWIGVASMLAGIGILLAGGDPQTGLAAIYGGQAAAIGQQLRFSREAESEADRIGFTLLRDAGYEVSAMPLFFNRLDQATRVNQAAGADFVRSHPLTQERISDIQNRVRTQANQPSRAQRPVATPDPLFFGLLQTRVRVLAYNTDSGRQHNQLYFANQLSKGGPTLQATLAQYGLVMVALESGAYDAARNQLAPLRSAYPDNAFFAFTELQINLRSGENHRALAYQLMQKFPSHRGFVWLYIETLLAQNAYATAIAVLRTEIRHHKNELQLYEKLAKTYSLTGQSALQHLTLAELYDRAYEPQAAIEQVEIALRAKDLTLDDQAILQARLKQYRANLLRDKQNAKPGS